MQLILLHAHYAVCPSKARWESCRNATALCCSKHHFFIPLSSWERLPFIIHRSHLTMLSTLPKTKEFNLVTYLCTIEKIKNIWKICTAAIRQIKQNFQVNGMPCPLLFIRNSCSIPLIAVVDIFRTFFLAIVHRSSL